MLEDDLLCWALSAGSQISACVHLEDECTGVLAARAASTVTGRASEDTGIRIESIIKAGLTGPMAEALAMYYQVCHMPQRTSTRLMLIPILCGHLSRLWGVHVPPRCMMGMPMRMCLSSRRHSCDWHALHACRITEMWSRACMLCRGT